MKIFRKNVMAYNSCYIFFKNKCDELADYMSEIPESTNFIFVETEIDKRRGAGAIIGLIQGIVILFAIVIPLNGLAVQVDKLSQIKIEMPSSGEQTTQSQPLSLEIPAGSI